MSVSDTWGDWDAGVVTPPPLPSFPSPPEAVTKPKMASSGEPGKPTASDSSSASTHASRWSLVSADGRATMRVPKRFVVGSGACCDLRLSDHGIASHHAMLSVEDDTAYVTPLSDSPTLLDGEAIAGRRRLHRHSALMFGPASFRVEHDGPVPEPAPEPAEPRIANETITPRRHADTPSIDDSFRAPPTRDQSYRPSSSPKDEGYRPSTPPNDVGYRAQDERYRSAPHVSSPKVDVRFDHIAPRRRRRGKAWIAWLLLTAVIAAAWWWPVDVFELIGWNPDSRPVSASVPVESVATPPVAAPRTEVLAPRVDPSTASTSASPTPAPEPVALPEPKQAPVPPAQSTQAALPTPAAAPREASASDATAALLAEAEALESQGHRVTPAGQNAAERYLRVLQAAPDSQLAHTRLDRIVGAVARDASDMILRQRFDGARRAIEQLAVAIPESRRSLVGKETRGQWRVVQLLLDADALMQQYRLVGPDDPNAVGLLREALRIDPNNAIADEMLSKAYGLQAERDKQ